MSSSREFPIEVYNSPFGWTVVYGGARITDGFKSELEAVRYAADWLNAENLRLWEEAQQSEVPPPSI